MLLFFSTNLSDRPILEVISLVFVVPVYAHRSDQCSQIERSVKTQQGNVQLVISLPTEISFRYMNLLDERYLQVYFRPVIETVILAGSDFEVISVFSSTVPEAFLEETMGGWASI